MKKYFTLTILLMSLIMCSFIYGQTVAIKAGHLVDPADGKAAKDQIILVEAKKITAVGTEIDLSKADRSSIFPTPGFCRVSWMPTFI